MAVLSVRVSLPPQEVKPNSRPHHMAKARATALYRESAEKAASDAMKEQNFELPEADCAFVKIRYYFPTKRVMDKDNCLCSLKAVWDGFTDAGVWKDDRDITYLPVERYVDREDPRLEIEIGSPGEL